MNWENQFQSIKNQFVDRSKERLQAIESLLLKLQTSPSDESMLRLIMQHFHWLAGSGGTYGFDDITQWGTYGEELCDYLLKLHAPVSAADQDKLMTALRTVEQLFQAQVSTPNSSMTGEVHQKMRSTAELLIPPGALMNTIQAEANRQSAAANVHGASSSGPAGAFNQLSSMNSSPPSTVPGSTNYPGQSGFPPGGSGGGGSAFPATPQAGSYPPNTQTSGFPASPNQSDIRTTSQHPIPNAGPPPGADPSTTRVLGSNMSAPPLSSGGPATADNTQLLAGPATRPSTAEARKLRLGHIPSNRKFAILVDSNLNNLMPIKSTLEERGLIVEGFVSASEVKAAFAERLPDVLVVGAPLIDNNGYELVEFIRAMEAGHKPIVILLAQQAVFLDKVQAIRAGADAFFEYPAELPDLTEKLHTLLDREKNENYKILSVEDDPDQANFIKLTLQSAGYTIMHISDPKTFEEHFLSFEPDLVMLDVLLGDLTGFELAKYIRQNDRFATLPIVFLTTQNKLHQHIRSAIAGGDEHLIKPVAPQLLIATVASRLERARALKRLIDRDGLTRCLNFGSFMERAQKLAGMDGYRAAPAMMMIDIDNMKRINEKMGFAAGDRIISNIANMLLKGFRNTDLIARFGNDQFAIVLEHLNVQQLQSLSSQVLGAISGTPQLVKGRSVSVTCSGGVAVLEQGMSVQEWLSSAQDALKKAKDAGGNRAIVKSTSR